MTRSYSLRRLLAAWHAFASASTHPHPPEFDGDDAHFGRIVEDSRRVQPGDCFVARVRPYSDGHPFIPQAIERGATLVIAQDSAEMPALDTSSNAVVWRVPDTAVVESWLAAAMHGFPGAQMTVLGVTGTDGKTSIANLLYEILVHASYKSGMISTIKAVIGNQEEPTGLHVTTPQAPELQALLRRMADDGVTHCILEATSMGLAEHRVDSALIDVAVVSNVTHEHLDYHGSYDAYLQAKARLFELASQSGIINGDDNSAESLHLTAVPDKRVYAIDREDADATARNIVFSASDTRFDLHLSGQTLPIVTPLAGRFTVYNMLAAAAAGEAVGCDPAAIQRGLEAVRVISGRMERIDRGQPFQVLVDFAHTPNALARAIEAARGMCTGRIVTVFGSAGRRDVAKRRLMAEISAESADLTILTAEDPRAEPLDEILSMMVDGCLAKGGVENETFWRIPDRGRAIYHAFGLVRPNDLVLICGKGHEQSMCFQTTEYPWDDRDAARSMLDAFLHGKPPPDLGLPTFGSGQ